MSTNSANAYGAQMAKYFTMNQPPHVAIDSADSVVRPQLAITRLIARSGIPERTASIPSESAYVVSVHLNHANSGRMGTLDRWKAHQRRGRGPWAESRCATWSQIRVFETRARLTGFTTTFRVPPWIPLRTMPECARVKRLHCVYGTADPTLHHLTQVDPAVSEQAGDVLSVVHGFFHDDDLFAPCRTVWSASRSHPAFQRRSCPVAKAPRRGIGSGAPGW